MTAAFGVTEGHRVRSRIDNQLQKALSLFDDARELLETREAIKSTKKSPQVATARRWRRKKNSPSSESAAGHEPCAK